MYHEPMRLSRVFALPALIAAVLVTAMPARATTFFEQPFPESVKQAPIIVRAKVGASTVDWGLSQDGAKRIYTYYDIQVDEVFKGKVAGTNLKMREMGGEKDGLGMHVAGAAQFERGEDVVMMLNERNLDGSYDVLGLMTGKYNIRQNESGKETLVGFGIQGEGDGHDHGNRGSQTGTGDEKEWTLEGLRQLVREQAVAADSAASSQNSASNAGLQNPSSAPPSTGISSANPAPQLQSASSGEPADSPQFGFPLWLTVGLGVLGGFAGWAIWRRK